MTAQTLTREQIEAAQLRASCAQSLWAGLVGQLLGAFPDHPEIVDIIAEKHGAEINRALDFVAARVVHEIRAEGLVPVHVPMQASGYLTAVIEGAR